MLSGRYKRQPVRRVQIAKPDGGARKLGSPTVADRVIQQAFLQVLQKYWDPIFSGSSFGFRPGRSAHQAVRRGHRFVRYADDANIYVRSQKAGARVMLSITQFNTERLKLKVNENKSAVDRPQSRKFLGFSFTKTNRRQLAVKTVKRFRERVKVLTSRTGGRSVQQVISKLSPYLKGWVQYFGIAQT